MSEAEILHLFFQATPWLNLLNGLAPLICASIFLIVLRTGASTVLFIAAVAIAFMNVALFVPAIHFGMATIAISTVASVVYAVALVFVAFEIKRRIQKRSNSDA